MRFYCSNSLIVLSSTTILYISRIHVYTRGNQFATFERSYPADPPNMGTDEWSGRAVIPNSQDRKSEFMWIGDMGSLRRQGEATADPDNSCCLVSGATTAMSFCVSKTYSLFEIAACIYTVCHGYKAVIIASVS
jgi:hypothetical protein